MRVNIYAEELTDRVEIVEKVINGVIYIGVRFYLELPVSVKSVESEFTYEVKGPFFHRASFKDMKDGVGQYEVDDDSSAVTFWGKRDLVEVLTKAIGMINEHYVKQK